MKAVNGPQAFDVARLRGSLVALATPFRDGEVDVPALAALCDRQARRGTAALVVCGTTGEAPALSPAEQAMVVAVAVRVSDGRLPVIAGCTASATDGAAMLAETATRAGATALLCAPPPYSRPTQDGIAAHFRTVFHAADLPILLYDVPARVGVAVADATLARLFAGGIVAGIKDATGDLSRPPRLRAMCGPGLLQFGGDDATAAAYRAMGGDGCISVTANVVPSLCAQMHVAWDRGDLARFAELRDALEPLHWALFLESNPIPLKAALATMRLCGGEMRLPLTRAAADTQARLATALDALAAAEEDAARPRLARGGLALVG